MNTIDKDTDLPSTTTSTGVADFHVGINAGVYNICEPYYDNWETAFQAYQSNEDLKELISDRNAKEKEMENINRSFYNSTYI